MQKLDLSAFLKCCCFLLALLGQSAYGFAQTSFASNNSYHLKTRSLTVQQAVENKVLLKDALDNLKKQFKIQIAYHEGLLDNKFVPASVVNNARLFNLDDNLKQLLSVFQLEYRKINDNQISIFSVKESTEIRVAAVAVITGKVIDAVNNEPIIDAFVLLKADPKIGTSTDGSGSFKLTIPEKYADKPVTLQVAYIGYDKAEITVSDFSVPVQKEVPVHSTRLWLQPLV
jgi:hypothetical protein